MDCLLEMQLCAANTAAHSQRSCAQPARPTQRGHQESLRPYKRNIYTSACSVRGTANPTACSQCSCTGCVHVIYWLYSCYIVLTPTGCVAGTGAPSCVYRTAARSCVFRTVTFTQVRQTLEILYWSHGPLLMHTQYHSLWWAGNASSHVFNTQATDFIW